MKDIYILWIKWMLKISGSCSVAKIPLILLPAKNKYILTPKFYHVIVSVFLTLKWNFYTKRRKAGKRKITGRKISRLGIWKTNTFPIMKRVKEENGYCINYYMFHILLDVMQFISKLLKNPIRYPTSLQDEKNEVFQILKKKCSLWVAELALNPNRTMVKSFSFQNTKLQLKPLIKSRKNKADKMN